MAVALAALFLALAGTGIAASRYVVSSTTQIKPSVLAALRGAHIVNRVHLAAPTASGATPTALSLVDPGWTQTPGEIELLVGYATVKIPSATACTIGREGLKGSLQLELYVNHEYVRSRSTSAGVAAGESDERVVNLTESATGLKTNSRVGSSVWLFEQPKPKRNGVVLSIHDGCGEEGGVATEHFTVESVSLDAVGIP